MWDWSGTKTPPPGRSRGGAAEEAQNQGVTPVRREIRPVPVYRDSRSYRTSPPTISTYPDPLEVPMPQAPYSGMQPYSQQQPAYPQRSVMPPQAPPAYPSATTNSYTPQPYIPYPQQQPSMPQTYPASPYMPSSPYPQQPYMSPYGQGTPSYPTYTPVTPQQQSYTPYQQASSVPMPVASDFRQEDKSLWEWHFQQTGLVNMDLIEADFVPLDPAWLLELRKAFKRTRRDFLKYVGYHHVNELLAAGLTEDAIKLVKKGKAPENFNIHIRIPFDYGGTNSFSNLVLIQTHPFHTEIHRFIDMQTLSQPNLKPRKLFLPAPKGKVYFPGEIEISSGGASRHDRSVYAGFLESTFEMIAQKSSLGR